MGINRIRLQNGAMGDPRVDARMQQTYQQNIADNQAQQARNEGIFQAARDKLQGFGNTLTGVVEGARDYTIPVVQGARALLTGAGEPIITDSMRQDLIQRAEAKGGDSGFLGYEDYGLTPAGNVLGGRFGGGITDIISDPQAFANAATLGRVTYDRDPETGEYSFGDTNYDFNIADTDTGLGANLLRGINEGGLTGAVSNLLTPTTAAAAEPSAMPQGSPGQLNPTPTPDAGTITLDDGRVIADDGMGRDDVQFYVSPEGTYYPPGYNGTGSAIFVDNLPNKQNQKPTIADVAGPSRETIIQRILKEIEPGFENENSIARMYPDQFKTGLDLDYLKTLNPDEVKLALDNAYLQGENFQNPDFSTGRIGGGSPFFRYGPQYMEQFNMQGGPLQLSDQYTGYNLRNQLGELESILGKEGIKPYRTKADDALMDFYKTQMSGDSDLQKRIFGLASGGRVGFQDGSPEEMIKAQEAAASDPALDAIRQQLFGEDYVQDIGEGRGIAQYYTGFGLPQSLQFTPPVVEEAAPVVDVTQPVVDAGGGDGQDLATTPITTTPITTTPTIDGEGITPDDTFIGGGATLEDAGGVPDLGGVYATDYQGEGVGNLADYPINTGYGTNPATGQPYQTPRTIADQNAVLGQTFDEQKDPSFWENARDTFNETGQDIGNFFTRAKDQGIDFTKMAGTTILNLAGKAVMGVPLLGTALSLIGGGLPPRDPRQTALEELYDVGDGTIQSGLMAGYNPVSGNPLDPTFGLQDAYQDRIDNIENTLQDKYNMTDQEIADLYAGSYTGDVDTNLLDDVVELKDMKEKEKGRLDLFSGDVDERDQMLEDISLQNKIDAGIAAADEEPASSGDGPQEVDAGTADIQDFADIYEPPSGGGGQDFYSPPSYSPPSYSPPSYSPPSGGGGQDFGGGGGNTGGGYSRGDYGGRGHHWAKGGIVSLKNAKR